jgi:hypothetical protein
MSKLDSTDLNLLPSGTSINHSQPAQNISLEKSEIFEKNLEALTLSRDNDLKNLSNNHHNIQQHNQNQSQSQIQSQQMQANLQKNLQQNNIVGGNGIDHTMINQVVNGIQQASANGLTSLRTRDIPMNPSQITQDSQTLPNYVPSMPVNKQDYISTMTTQQDIINKYNSNRNKEENINTIYDELQIPILISILYFLFQLPVVKSYLFKYAPSLFNKDGNNNLFGYIFNSILFGLSYYLLLKCLNHISN